VPKRLLRHLVANAAGGVNSRHGAALDNAGTSQEGRILFCRSRRLEVAREKRLPMTPRKIPVASADLSGDEEKYVVDAIRSS
jgi:hypothetical protein